MFTISNESTIRIFNNKTGDTEKLIKGEVELVNENKAVTINISNAFELENDNLNVYETKKNSRLEMLHKLLEQNKRYYFNKNCFGYYYGADKVESYRCDQCGDWNGTEGVGTFREFLLGDVVEQLEYPLSSTIEDLNMKSLFNIDEFDFYILKDESKMNQVIDELMECEGLYDNNIYLTVENDDLIISMKDVPSDIIKEALVELMTKSEE